MEDNCCKFKGFINFITKDDKKLTVIEAALKKDKDKGDSITKREKRKKENQVVHYCIIQF